MREIGLLPGSVMLAPVISGREVGDKKGEHGFNYRNLYNLGNRSVLTFFHEIGDGCNIH